MPVYDDHKTEEPLVDQDEDTMSQPKTSSNNVASNLLQREGEPLDSLGAEPLSQEEQAKLDDIEENYDSEYIPYRKEESKRFNFRSKLNKRNGTIIGVILTLVVGGFVGTSIISGPLQLIQFGSILRLAHFSNLTEFDNDRSARRTYYLLKGQQQRSNLGYINNKIADKVELRLNNEVGLKSVYSRGTLTGYEVLDEKKASRILNDLRSDDVDLVDRNGKKFIDFNSEKFIGDRKKLTRAIVSASDLDGIAEKLSSRLLIKRAGINFHNLTSPKRLVTQKLYEYYDEIINKHNEEIRNGTSDLENTIHPPEEDTGSDTNGDGKIEGAEAPSPESKEASAAAKEIIGETDVAAGDISSEAATKTLRTSLLEKLKGAAAIAGVLCTLKDLGKSAEKLQYTQTILPMMRTAMSYVSIASQIQSGQDFNIEELGAFHAKLYDDSNDNNPDTLPSSVFSARPFQAMRGEEMSGPDIADYLKPAKLGEKPIFFRTIDNIPGLDKVCDVNNTIGNLPIIKQFGELTSTLVAKVIPIDQLINGIVGWLAGKGMDYSAKGSPLGYISMYGARLAANNQFSASGGLEMTPEETAQLTKYNSDSVNYAFNHQSKLAKIFDIRDPRSVSAKISMSAPRSPSSALAVLLSSPFKLFSTLIPRAKATTQAYDYGFNAVGFTVDEMNNPEIADPYKNAEEVEAKLPELNSKYGMPCFNIRVELADGGVKVITGGQDYNAFDPSISEKIKECNQSTDPMLLKYRAYISDAVGTQSEACWEGVGETSCQEIGFNESTSNTTQTSTSTSTPALGSSSLNGYTIPCSGQQTPVIRKTPGWPSADWTGIKDSGTIGYTSTNQPIKVYIREACDSTNAKTLVIVSSIHGSENGGQLVSHELLFNANLPKNVRIIAIPELNGSGIINGDRKNSNGVDLNRNNDYQWATLISATETSPNGKFYKGTAPGSEPETKAINSFLSSLGKVDLSLHYHDNLNYVASVGNTRTDLAQLYGSISGLSIGNNGSTTVTQRGSLDAWYNSKYGTSTLLVEMSSDQSAGAINKHVEAVKAILSSGKL